MVSRRASHLIFFFAFAAILLAMHWPLLTLPFHWDELGQFVPAALDLYRDGAWVPHSTLPNVHPPGVMLLLALVWKVFGFSILSSRLTMLADRRSGRVSFVPAGDPVVAQVARRAGYRGGGVPDRSAAFLHAVDDGAARHARHDADGFVAPAVSRRALCRLRPGDYGAGFGQGNRHQHSHGVRRLAVVSRKTYSRGALFPRARGWPWACGWWSCTTRPATGSATTSSPDST